MSEQFEGGCLCGAVRFVATGKPKSVAWCHCQSCRRHSGAPVSVFVAFRRAAYVVTKGEVTRFNLVAGRGRGFCARCGSMPRRHIFPEERLPWLHLADAKQPTELTDI